MSCIVLHKIKVGCFVSTRRSHPGGWTAEGLRELTKRAIVFPNRKAIDWSGHFVIFFSQKSCSDEEIMFSNNMPILSFLQSSNYSAQHAACIRNTNARVQCVIHLLNRSARADLRSIFSQTRSFELPGSPKQTWSQSTSKLNVILLC